MEGVCHVEHQLQSAHGLALCAAGFGGARTGRVRRGGRACGTERVAVRHRVRVGLQPGPSRSSGAGRTRAGFTQGRKRHRSRRRDRDAGLAASCAAGETEESNLSTELRQDEDKKAREKAEQQIKLQEVLATVWKASAAVVDVVLGRDAAEAAAAAAEGKVDGVSSSAQVAAVGGAPASVDDPWATPEQADLLPSAWRREQDPEAYTEQGVGSWSPRETGLLISHRV
jgi:hypothetical protein